MLILFSSVKLLPINHKCLKETKLRSQITEPAAELRVALGLSYFSQVLHGSQPCHGEGAFITQWSYEACCAGPTKMAGLWQNVVHRRRDWQDTTVKNPMNSMIRQKGMTLEDELPWLKLSNITTREKWRIVPEGLKKVAKAEMMLSCGCVW